MQEMKVGGVALVTTDAIAQERVVNTYYVGRPLNSKVSVASGTGHLLRR